jgi:hypothetical protein
METGVFSSIGKSYIQAAKNVFVYLGKAHFTIKPIILIPTFLYGILLFPIGIIFYLFIVLDWFGKITDKIRYFFINAIEKNSYKIDNSFFSFLLRPIVMVILIPLFLLTLCIPKLSSSVDVDMTGIADAAGTFKQIQQISWRSAKNLFSYVSNAPLLMMPILAIVAIIYSLVLISIGLIFSLLIPLDWISRLIEIMREGIASFSHHQQQQIRDSFGSFLFSPLLLIMLAPVFFILLIIPKFSGEIVTSV